MIPIVCSNVGIVLCGMTAINEPANSALKTTNVQLAAKAKGGLIVLLERR